VREGFGLDFSVLATHLGDSGVAAFGGLLVGLMFGAGMILARGCASRLLVLSGTGNMRALVAGLILTVVAKASPRGALPPSRDKIRTFDQTTPLPRYIIGASLMGFGSMLAGGCAVGAGVTGRSVMALTALVALAAMWVGAGLTDLLVDRPAAWRTRLDASRSDLLDINTQSARIANEKS